MRIAVCDYSGHPFQAQLSRELARRGHAVCHLHFAGFQTPKGNLARQEDDPATLELCAVALGQPFAKGSLVRRRRQEAAVGRLIADRIARFAPDAVLSGNAPLDTQRAIQAAAHQCDARFVFWVQDIYSHAIGAVLPQRLPLLGHGVAAWYRRLERRLLRASDAIVAISPEFAAELAGWGIDPARTTVIENWAPLDEIACLPRGNPWARANFAGAGPRFVYSGTLGYKHDPHWLLALARRFPEAEVAVFSEGAVAAALARQAQAAGLANLAVRPWVPFADLPAMLAGADVLIAFIEPEAGRYSVPSKILTYLAAGRPVLAAIAPGNLAARIIASADAGRSVDCADTAGFLTAAAELLADPALRERLGANARAHALRAFDIAAIADRFVAVLSGRGERNMAA